jgi:hypothetical protein
MGRRFSYRKAAEKLVSNTGGIVAELGGPESG